MTVKQLKAVIADLRDDMVIVQECGDHEMRLVHLAVGPVYVEAVAPRSMRLTYAPFDLEGNTNGEALIVT